MQDETPGPFGWKQFIALAISSLAVLAALVAVRGPDPVAPDSAVTAGAWLASGPGFWHPLTPLGAFLQIPYQLAGPRGWQNAHVLLAWLSVLAWFLALPSRYWRGLGPLLPALLAVLLSSPEAGLSGFGLAVLVLSTWRWATERRGPWTAVLSLAAAAWLAAWFSPGAVPVILAAWLTLWPRRPRLPTLGLLPLLAVVLSLTPRGLALWNDAFVFLRWSPQAAPSLWGGLALIASLLVLPFALRGAWRTGQLGLALGAALLFLAATAGQTAYLWAAALWMIPCWSIAREQVRRIGLNLRWFVEAAVILLAALLVTAAGFDAGPRWYALAMTKAVVQPTLTRQALPADALTYINPGGLALARFSGPWPAVDPAAPPDPRLGRDPSLWRAQDRHRRYGAVWLLGDKSGYAPLARHLGESPDWRLAATDPTGVLFVRGTPDEVFPTEPAQQEARDMWGGANRSTFLAATALTTLAAHALPEAGELSQSAVRNSDRSAVAAATRARVLASLGETRAALDKSARALRLDPRLPLAWQVRCEVLLQAGRADEAMAAAQRALRFAPGDSGTLWLAARAAHQARAFQTEAEILEQLIALTEGRGGDAGFYHLYLGQSYARQGLARPALRSLQKAAEAPGLTACQQREIDEEIAAIRAAPGAF